MTPAELLLLAERVEAASGPDREMDLAIAIMLGKAPANTIRGNVTGFCYFDEYSSPCCVTIAQYTASLDAAMSLVPKGFGFIAGTNLDNGKGQATVSFQERGNWYHCGRYAATPALALTAAALRARAQADPEGGRIRG